MAQEASPNAPQSQFQFVDVNTGRLTQYGLTLLTEFWRRIADGHMVIPCSADMVADVITLTPLLNQEGASTYAPGLIFTALMHATSAGAVTAKVQSGTTTLTTVKVLKDDGATQAGAGDVVDGCLYLFAYHPDLDGGAGAFVLK